MKINKVIIALDFNEINQTKKFVNKFKNPVWFKLGMELIYSNGFEIISWIKEKGHRVFLDLKLHDIPNTVNWGIKSLSKYNVDMISVHTLGGAEMMRQAIKSFPSTKILGVTILTSINQETLSNELGIKNSIKNQVQLLATLAQKANAYGIVCSSNDIPFLQNINIKKITPGIRRKEDVIGDQKRITTPSQARISGSDYIVVGRPITKSSNPTETYRQIVEEFNNG